MKWEAGVRQSIRGQPRESTKTNDCLRTSLVSNASDIRGKAASAYSQGVVDSFDDVQFRLSEVVVVLESSELVKKCRGSETARFN